MTGSDRCDLCETLEAETTEEVENDETGEVIEADLCGPCANKLRDYSRGEDVDFSDELRLPLEDDGLRADGGTTGIGVFDSREPCPCDACDGWTLSPDEYCVECMHAGCGPEPKCRLATDGGESQEPGTDQEKVAESDDAGVSEAAAIETVVDGPEDHDRATRELALAVAGLVDEALDETGHPVKITLDAEVADQTRTDGGVDQSGSERPDRARFECTCGSSTAFPRESFAKLHWLVGRFGYRNVESAIDDLHDCCDNPDHMETRGWEELREDGDGLRTDGGVPDLRSHLDDALERARQNDAELATLAFATEYVEAVRAGEKTVTLRRPGAYDVAVRHAAERDAEIVLVDGQREPFARAQIRAVWKVDAEAVAEARLAGYPDLACADDVVRILERHYELEIGGDAAHTRVHAIHFDVTELLRPAVLEGGEA